MKKPSRPDGIDVQALHIGMYVDLDIGWMSHPLPLSSFRITTAAQLATIRSLGLRTVRLEPAAEPVADPARGRGAIDGACPGRWNPFRRRRQRLRLGDADAIDAVPYMLPVDDNVVGAAAHAAQRAQAEGHARWRASAAEEALRAPVRRSGTGRSAHARALSRQAPEARTGRGAVEVRSPRDGRRAGPVHSSSPIKAAGDKESMHAINVGYLADGPLLGFGEAEMLDLGVGAMLHDVGKLGSRCAPAAPRRQLHAGRAGRLRVARQAASCSQAHGSVGGRDGGVGRRHEHAHGPASRQAEHQPDDLRRPHRRPRRRYDDLCNPHLLAQGDDAAPVAVAAFAQGHPKYDTTILGAFIEMIGVYPPGSTSSSPTNGTRSWSPSTRPDAEAQRGRPRPATRATRRSASTSRAQGGVDIRRSIRARRMRDRAGVAGAEHARRHEFEPAEAADARGEMNQSAAGRPGQRRRGGASHPGRR